MTCSVMGLLVRVRCDACAAGAGARLWLLREVVVEVVADVVVVAGIVEDVGMKVL